MSKPRRLDQWLSCLGYGSRREAQGLIARGKVTVAGVIATRPETRALAADILINGQPLEEPDGLLAVYHKPLGVVCTHTEDEGPSVYDKLPTRWLYRNPAITSIGRLDKDTSGLLLLTDVGPLVQRCTSPKSRVSKVYEVTVEKPLSADLIAVFASGTLTLRNETTPCLPAHLEIVDPLHARLTITEGRYHQVRRMFASQAYHVVELHRSRFGPYELGDLAPGSWRLLDATAALAELIPSA